MSRTAFHTILKSELDRLDSNSVSKRKEKIIEDFTKEVSPKAVIAGKEYRIFNSNDYLGLRHHPALKAAEHAASEQYGTGPGAVRFISGSMKVHRDLEVATAKFHGKTAAMVFSSAFATNFAVLHALIKGQAADSLVGAKTLVVSDALNHRSIIDGIRVANLDKEARPIFAHMNAADCGSVLQENVGKFDRALIVTDGVFSMLGEYQDLKSLRKVADDYDTQYPEGVWLIVDDAHGVGAFGKTGRGTEEVCDAKADILIGTYGKGFGADGGYVVADQVVIDYLHESAASYIYSNSISPGTAAAAKAAIELIDTEDGKKLLAQLEANIAMMKTGLKDAGFTMAAESIHPIQPLLIGDAAKNRALGEHLFANGILATALSYPVVQKGRDEIRIQLSGAHTPEDVKIFLQILQSWK